MGVHPFDQADGVGEGMAAGDFNHDGYDDLAVGAYNASPLPTPNGFAGAVYVLYGTADGPASDGFQSWYENRDDLSGAPARLDFFGFELTAGNFNGDDYDDLAIGSPNKEVGGVVGAGSILIQYGSDAGLDAEGHQYVDQPGLFLHGPRRRVGRCGAVRGRGLSRLDRASLAGAPIWKGVAPKDANPGFFRPF